LHSDNFSATAGAQSKSDGYRIAVHDCEFYVQMLMEFNNMGDLMRSAMTKALINPQVLTCIFIIYITYHSRFIPEGVAEASQVFLRDAYVLSE
jgi:hypothetical protein